MKASFPIFYLLLPTPLLAYHLMIFAAVISQSLIYVQLYETPWTPACQASLSSTISRSLVKFISLNLEMLLNHFILCCPFFPFPSIFPRSSRNPQESSPAPWFKSINSLASTFFLVKLSHLHMTTGKIYRFYYTDLCWQSDVPVFNTSLVLSWIFCKEQGSFNFVAAVTIHEPKKIKYDTASTFFHFYLPWSDGTGCHDLTFFFLNVEFQATIFILLFHPHQEAF